MLIAKIRPMQKSGISLLRNVPLTIWETGFFLGTVIILLQCTALTMPVGEPRDWVMYCIVGGTTGISIIFSFLQTHAKSFSAKIPSVSFSIKQGVAFYSVIASSYYVAPALFEIKYLSVWVIAFWLFRSSRNLPFENPINRTLIVRICIIFYVILLFAADIKLRYYEQQSQELAFSQNSKQIFISLLINIIAAVLNGFCLLAFTSLVYNALFKQRPSPIKKFFIWRSVSHLLVFLTLIALCFRTDGFGYEFVAIHWSAITEPSESVRAGGWLLWDVPALYGFLSSLVLAFIPAGSTWQSLYLLNSSLMVIYGYVLFALLIRQAPSLAGYIFSALISISLVTYFPSGFHGDSRLFPSTGCFRFLWLYCIVGYIYIIHRIHISSHTPNQRWYAAGDVIWILGVLWSPESAVFTSLVWLPSLACFAAADAIARENIRIWQIVQHGLVRIMDAICMLIAAICAISAYYKIYLGVWPDFTLYSAYVGAFPSHTFGPLPIVHFGAAASALCLFLVISAVIKAYVSAATVDAAFLANSAFLYAILACLWSCTSYYIVRSHDNNVVNLIPVYVFSAILLAEIVPSLKLSAYITTGYKLAYACLLVSILFITLISINKNYARDTSQPLIEHDIKRLVNQAPETLKSLLLESNIPQNSRILILPTNISIESVVLPLTAFVLPNELKYRPWLLPNTNTAFTYILTPEQYYTYAKRYAERSCDDGWIIDPVSPSLDEYPWIVSVLNQYYSLKEKYDNTEWHVRHYVRTKPCA